MDLFVVTEVETVVPVDVVLFDISVWTDVDMEEAVLNAVVEPIVGIVVVPAVVDDPVKDVRVVVGINSLVVNSVPVTSGVLLDPVPVTISVVELITIVGDTTVMVGGTVPEVIVVVAVEGV